MIDFTRAFDSAWERMMIILFRPFDLGKWCIIGLSAFLAGFLQGGNGFNGGGSFNDLNRFTNKQGSTQTFDFEQIHSTFSNLVSGIEMGLLIFLFAAAILIGLALALVIYWLGARGQFLFLDNIVRNRGNVSWPWQYYARQANSLFLFYLLLIAVSLAIFIPILVVAVVMAWPLMLHHHRPDGGQIAGFVVLAIVYLVMAFVIGVVIFIFRELGVPLMFRHGWMARPAFVEALKLAQANPGNIAILILLRVALAIAVMIISLIACCFCCIGAIPYVGTVVILPALIYVRCFTLDCLAQLGPQYDVWTVDLPPASPAAVTPSPLPPPV